MALDQIPNRSQLPRKAILILLCDHPFVYPNVQIRHAIHLPKEASTRKSLAVNPREKGSEEQSCGSGSELVGRPYGTK
jgi:hypothetical protein